MKKILTAAICMALLTIVATSASAQQKGDMAWGVQAAYSSGDGASNFGLGAKFRYNVTTPIRLEGSFTYFLESDHLSMWDLSANAQWLFPVADQVTVYPLAGLGVFGAKVDVKGFGNESDSELGLNLGGGADFGITDSMAITAELKYNTAYEQLVLSAGVAFKF